MEIGYGEGLLVGDLLAGLAVSGGRGGGDGTGAETLGVTSWKYIGISG